MARYSYTGKRINGELVEGTINAATPDKLQEKLLDRGVFLETHREVQSSLHRFFIRHLKKNDVTRATRQLSALVSSGITFDDALHSVREQVTDKTLGAVIDDIIQSIESGRSIADSFSRHPAFFDTFYVSLLEAGEISGTLDASLDRIASYREKSEEIQKKIRTALAYPILVLAVTIIVVFILVLYIIPIFSSMYENFGSELPQLTQRVVDASRLIQSNMYLFVTLILAWAIGTIMIFTNRRIQYFISYLQLKIPILNRLTIKVVNARFSRTLGTLLQSGVSMLFAVEVASRTSGNEFAKARLKTLSESLSRGKSFTETISDYSFFTKTLARMSAAGEKTGQLGTLLTKAADFYDSEVDHDIGTLMSLFEPLIIIFIGLFIAFILIAMYMPLFDLISTL